MTAGVLVIGLDGGLLVYNRPAEALLGLPAGTLLVGDSLAAVRAPPAITALVERLRQAPVGAEAHVADLGPGSALHASGAVVAGEPPAIMLMLRAVRADARRRSLRRDFIADLSHEVRSPLAAIRGCSATLLAGALGDGPQARHFVEVIAQHAERLGTLVDDLARLADLELGRVVPRRQAVGVAAAIGAAAAACRARALRGGVALATAVEGVLPPLDADRALFEEALLRVLDQAIGRTPRDGRVGLQAAAGAAAEAGGGGAWVSVAVTDSGDGAAAPDEPRRSERFGRADRARACPPGSGLGLAVVEHIMRAHGGRVQICRAGPRGTVVTLLWPVAAAGARARRAAR